MVHSGYLIPMNYIPLFHMLNTIIANDNLAHEMSEEKFDEYLKLVAVVKEDFESLSYNIYNMWMKKMEKIWKRKLCRLLYCHKHYLGLWP